VMHPASYSMGTSGSFLWGRAAEAWSWWLTSILCRGQKRWGYNSTPHTSWWHKHWTILPLHYILRLGTGTRYSTVGLRVNCCWSSPVQIILVSGSRGNHNHIFLPGDSVSRTTDPPAVFYSSLAHVYAWWWPLTAETFYKIYFKHELSGV
jgi:hypothetical protein